MKTGFALAIGFIVLVYKLGNRFLDIWEYKVHHAKREDRWQW